MYRIGIICPSEIAFRRFLPSIQRVKEFAFVGVAIATPEEWVGSDSQVDDKVIETINRERVKAQSFIDNFGGKIYEGYQTLLQSSGIDAVYIPLPPALHFQWAKMALEAGKNVFLEKPFTTNSEDTKTLLALASEKGLAVHENYMFMFHKQIEEVDTLIAEGTIGRVRSYRISFGFPRRAMTDFRYNKALGGGALLDAGGYCIKYASHLLGDTSRFVCANSYFEQDFEVDIFGSATLVNDEGVIAQITFGMANDYKCELEAWGSVGTITTGRILTAPDGFEPDLTIKRNQDYEVKKLSSDSAFEKSIRRFYECLENEEVRRENYKVIERQSFLVDQFINYRNKRNNE